MQSDRAKPSNHAECVMSRPLAIAQQGPRDFLTAKRASVSVKRYGVPSYSVARSAR